MPTRYGASPWIAESPKARRPDFPRLRGEHTCDVVIVGGGLTGCATAYACAMAGLKPLIIDADRVGQGSSGRSGGLLLSEPGPSFRDLAQAHGLRSARQVFEAWARGASDGAAILKRLKAPGGVSAANDVLVGFRGDEKALQREHGARDQAGVPSRWLSERQVIPVTRLDAVALRLRDGFAVDPYRACATLAVAASRRGGAFYERSPVRKVTAGRKGAEVVTADGVVHAGTVIVTTGIATAEFKQLRRHFKRRETYMVMTAPVPAAVRKLILPTDTTIRDARIPHHRIRWTADSRLLVSGADQDETAAKKRDAILVQRTGQLMYELLMAYPAISGLRPGFGWESTYAETADGLIYAGPHRNYPRHLFALGGDGQSLTGSFLAARVLARAAAGVPDKADQVFGWTR